MSHLGSFHHPRLATAGPGPRSLAARAGPQAGALVLAAMLLTCAADAQELRVSLTPTFERLRFDPALGLGNTNLYGGRLGVPFGRLVELQGFYLTSRGTNMRTWAPPSGRDPGGQPPEETRMDVRTYGANVLLTVGRGLVTPFVRGGGSVVRFSPAGADASNRVAFQYAGGVGVRGPRGSRLSVYAEDVRFRVDRTLLQALPAQATGAAPFDDDAKRLRSNVAVGAGITIFVGGGR